MAYQQTLRSPVTLAGIGLHSGKPARVRIFPAGAGHGVRFRRTDAAPSVEIPARAEFVRSTAWATVLGRDGVEVSTVEHCLAALRGLDVDNALVEVSGPELPILDGSALPYVRAVCGAGRTTQPAPRSVLQVVKPVRVARGEAYCLLLPAQGFRVTYSIDFGERFPEAQHVCLEITPGTFATELAPARTFGFLEDVQRLREAGKAQGGALHNAVVLHGGRVLNPEGLRMPDEMARHKMLDAVGDLSLCGKAIRGHLVVHRGGHALHTALVEALLARPDAWAERCRPESLPAHGLAEDPQPLSAAL
ncbi:MAG: UDP-3-O-acyl-N-acetylglucosamine deacetylase [Deferrisomatales bacterium]